MFTDYQYMLLQDRTARELDQAGAFVLGAATVAATERQRPVGWT